MKQMFNIAIEETTVGNFKVEAESSEEAFEIARNNYKNGSFVNEPGECQQVKLAVFDESKNIRIDFTEI